MGPAKTILVADDDPTVLQLVVEHYKKLGYSVHAAPDGLLLGIMAAKLRPDLVIADLMMPAAGGVRAFERIRSSQLTETVPVIFLTGVSMAEAAKMVPAAENVELLSKIDAMFEKLDEAVFRFVGKPDECRDRPRR